MSRPRDALATPSAFGDSAPELAPSAVGTAQGRAALVQSRIMAAVRARIGERGTSRAWVASQCGFSDRHLRRLMAGEQWVRLIDVVALSQALEVDLILLVGPQGPDGKRRPVRLAELE